jgi:hypothetical protein
MIKYRRKYKINNPFSELDFCKYLIKNGYKPNDKNEFDVNVVLKGDSIIEDRTFKINVGYFEEESRYADGTKLYDDLIKSDVHNPWSMRNIGSEAKNVGSFLSGLPVVGDDIQRAGQKVQNAFAQIGGLINPSLQAASQFIDPPVTDLGNIYGN